MQARRVSAMRERFDYSLRRCETHWGEGMLGRRERPESAQRMRRSSNGSVVSSARWRVPGGILALLRANYEIDVRQSAAFDPCADPGPASRRRRARAGRIRPRSGSLTSPGRDTSSFPAADHLLQAFDQDRARATARRGRGVHHRPATSPRSWPRLDRRDIAAGLGCAEHPRWHGGGRRDRGARAIPGGSRCRRRRGRARRHRRARRSDPGCGTRIMERGRDTVHQGGGNLSPSWNGVAGSADVSELGPCVAGGRRSPRSDRQARSGNRDV